MTAAAIVHIGPRSPAETAYDLAVEIRTGRWEDWLHDSAVEVRAEALAAEKRLATPAETALHTAVLDGAIGAGDAEYILAGLRPTAGVTDVHLALGALGRSRSDLPVLAEMAAADALLRHPADLDGLWSQVCEAVDEQWRLRTDPAAADSYCDACGHVTDRAGWRQDRLAALDEAIEGYARKAAGA